MRRLEVGSSKLPWGRSSLKETGVSAEWDEYVHDLHQLRLKHVRADVKEFMKTPRSLAIHKRMRKARGRKARREAVQEERYLEIERANRALLNRLSDVMRKPGDVVSMVQASMVQSGNTHKTLNQGYRKKEMKRIDAENEKLITRIESGESTYSRKAWASDRRKQEKYLKNLSRYRNGPQSTAMRTAPRMKKRGRHRRRKGSDDGGSKPMKGSDSFTGFMEWRRQKHHQKKKKWVKSLPPLERGGNSPSVQHSASAPSMTFSQPNLQMALGSTTMTETTLGSADARAHEISHRQGLGKYATTGGVGKGSPNIGGGAATTAYSRKSSNSPKGAVPNHTKVYEAGRQMNDGKFAVLSAITRGASLVIQAFVPEDQTTTEVEVTPKEAKYALRHLSNDIFRPERREELCRALVAKVQFFFKDNARMLLFNKTSLAGNPKSPVARLDQSLPVGGKSSISGPKIQSTRKKSPTSKRTSKGPHQGDGRTASKKHEVSFEEKEGNSAENGDENKDDAIRGALEGVLNLIPNFREGVLRKTDWIDAVNTSDKVKTVLRSEVLCGYPELRVLRQPGTYSNELHKLETSQNGFVDLDELLLFAKDLSMRMPTMASGSGGTMASFRAGCKLYNRSQRKSGRHVLLTLHDWCHLKIHDILASSQNVLVTQLPPDVADIVRRANTTNARVGVLKEYIIEEGLMVTKSGSEKPWKATPTSFAM